MKTYPKYSVICRQRTVLANNNGQRITINPGEIGTFQLFDITPLIIEATFPGKTIRFTPKGNIPNNNLLAYVTQWGEFSYKSNINSGYGVNSNYII